MWHWIRVHGGLYEKPVTTRLAEATRITQHEAVGVLVTFWSAVAANAANGYVATHSDAQLETWAKWSRKRGTFAAWVRKHHLDEDGRVREWDEYQGPLESRRESDRERKTAERIRRKSAGRHADGPQDVRKKSAPTIRNDTKQEQASSSARDVEKSGAHVEKSGRALLLAQLPPTRRQGMAHVLAMWEQGADLPPGSGVPTPDQIDSACRECVASVEAGNVSVNVLRAFLVKLLRPELTMPRKSESLVEALMRPGGVA